MLQMTSLLCACISLGASAAAFERPLRTDKCMAKKGSQAVDRSNSNSIDNDSKRSDSISAPSGDSIRTWNRGSNSGSEAWKKEGASQGHSDRGKCAATKGPFLLNGWRQAGAAKSCSRLFLWSVQGSGSTFAWQV